MLTHGGKAATLPLVHLQRRQSLWLGMMRAATDPRGDFCPGGSPSRRLADHIYHAEKVAQDLLDEGR